MSRFSKQQLIRGEINSWTLTISRIMGIVGMLYEIFIDTLHNPTALVVFAGLMGLPEAWELHKAIRKKAPTEE